MLIYKCLFATSSLIQDAFNLNKTKDKTIFVDFLLIFFQKNDRRFHGNRSTKNKKNQIVTFYTQLYFKHIETCIITS